MGIHHASGKYLKITICYSFGTLDNCTDTRSRFPLKRK